MCALNEYVQNRRFHINNYYVPVESVRLPISRSHDFSMWRRTSCTLLSTSHRANSHRRSIVFKFRLVFVKKPFDIFFHHSSLTAVQWSYVSDFIHSASNCLLVGFVSFSQNERRAEKWKDFFFFKYESIRFVDKESIPCFMGRKSFVYRVFRTLHCRCIHIPYCFWLKSASFRQLRKPSYNDLLVLYRIT